MLRPGIQMCDDSLFDSYAPLVPSKHRGVRRDSCFSEIIINTFNALKARSVVNPVLSPCGFVPRKLSLLSLPGMS